MKKILLILLLCFSFLQLILISRFLIREEMKLSGLEYFLILKPEWSNRRAHLKTSIGNDLRGDIWITYHRENCFLRWTVNRITLYVGDWQSKNKEDSCMKSLL